MSYCQACGHELEPGRFCARCGQPVDVADEGARTDTAERPAIRTGAAPLPPPPPPPPRAPGPSDYAARFPLYADQLAVTPTTEVVPWSDEVPSRRLAWPVLVGVALVLALVVGLGSWLLASGDDEPSTTGPTPGGTGSTTKDSGDKATSSEPPPKAPANRTELASGSRAEARVTAPPNQDLSGDPVRYVAANMLDGVVSTAWRMPGDGTGETLTFTLPSEFVLTEVGLINGYAKLDRDGRGHTINWYARNRRITRVTWSFDDGSTVTQRLGRTLRIQRLSLDPTRTTTVKLTLDRVSAPAARNGRNYTPISEIALVGG